MILVTEGYSAKNLGDAELVLQTVDLVGVGSEGVLSVLVVDPGSFQPVLPSGAIAMHRLFPRLDYLLADRKGRVLLLARWSRIAVGLSMLSLLPRTGARHRLARAVGGVTAEKYSQAEKVVAVGGGYLGDQYAKESVLTGWTWWMAGRMGAAVETMPISVELSRGIVGRFWARCSGRVQLRVRDRASLRRVQELGLSAELLPDLAFLNAGPHPRQPSVTRDEVAVALVGSDYLAPPELEDLVSHLVDAIRAASIETVSLISMHSHLNGPVGGDELASELLAAGLSSVGIATTSPRFATYEHLCEHLMGVRAVVSARMHAGIAGLCAGRPVGLLAYEDKHFALFNDLGMPDRVIDIRSSQDEIRHLIDSLIGDDGAQASRQAVARGSLLRESLAAGHHKVS